MIAMTIKRLPHTKIIVLIFPYHQTQLQVLTKKDVVRSKIELNYKE